MTRHTVITSFTEELYEEYGRECLRTYFAHWPSNVELVVYFEGDRFPEPRIQSGVRWVRMHEVDRLSGFLDDIGQFRLMSGTMPDGKYNINWDARQGRSIFMLYHAARQFGGKVFWMDADCITHADVPDTFLDEILPDDKLCCFHSRDGWYYSETGFIGYNAAHASCQDFLESCRGMYLEGSIFTQPGWHDCYAFDAIRRRAPAEWFHNLAAGLPQGCMHPIVNGPLGAYIDHKKGKRKASRSTKADLVVERTEPYWTESGAVA